jgi:TPR repeat protein
MYAAGRGVAQDESAAAWWYRQAAEQGHADAQLALGEMYAEGRGVAQDDAEAVTWYREAADRGVANAQLALGGMYFAGQGVAEDATEGARWWRLAAEQGYLPAQTGLAGRYFDGRGVPQDEVEAVRWYRRAAEQGDAEVLRWLHQTAEQGSIPAQGNLGEMYAAGRGVAPDVVQAHMWLSLAAVRASADQRQAYGAARDVVAQRMTREEFADAQRRALAWEAAHPPPP